MISNAGRLWNAMFLLAFVLLHFFSSFGGNINKYRPLERNYSFRSLQSKYVNGHRSGEIEMRIDL